MCFLIPLWGRISPEQLLTTLEIDIIGDFKVSKFCFYVLNIETLAVFYLQLLPQNQKKQTHLRHQSSCSFFLSSI